MTNQGYIEHTKDMPCYQNDPDSDAEWKFVIGEHTYGLFKILGEQLLDRLTVGKFCAIGANVSLLINGHEHDTGMLSSYPFLARFPEWQGKREEILSPLDRREVTIGHDVWIGQDAMIFSGVTIGSGAVIGARAIVRRDVPPYTIVKGVDQHAPRFDEGIAERMLALAWWDWPEELRSKAVPVLRTQNIDALERMKP